MPCGLVNAVSVCGGDPRRVCGGPGGAGVRLADTPQRVPPAAPLLRAHPRTQQALPIGGAAGETLNPSNPETLLTVRSTTQGSQSVRRTAVCRT